ncbi:MAG: hypothetical protein COV30_00445 [Candidatus Yanofskybacteria bacterium CG10_big_fil_rev_8_21_14_0_10_37_15]|uniref:DoxX family protein n=1 Tax=Candidatus Yanofskybacteria bacterium CG10_big_fil_rev_8_21_14_0_10_37_15 TaxID=1975097 RepID=A0A2H0R8B0_9BACT|nr:MAG: hypothetical protein COV30_00445 [Candidatus Yanofskybacteria bacterium CG10_big_fil_rev_8_21_14_0_10_37_15]
MFSKVSFFLLRVSLGWIFFYAGITKIFNSQWSAEGLLREASSLRPFFQWFAHENVLPLTNFVNEWGLTLLGISLILGVGIRLSFIPGIILMFLYYLLRLDFPYPNPQSFIVDQHIVYIFSLLVLGSFKAGRYWGLDGKIKIKFLN